MAVAGGNAHTDRPSPGPSVLWPLLCSAVLAGVLFAAEMGRLYRLETQPPSRERLGRSSSSESRRDPRWQWISVGSVGAAIAWLAASALLSWYLAHFANYDATY